MYCLLLKLFLIISIQQIGWVVGICSYHLFKTSSDLEILGGGGNLFNDSVLDEDIGSEMRGGHY